MALLPSSAIPSASGGGYTIDQSLRFNDDDSPRLNRTPTTSGNTSKWTFSCWMKRGNLGVTQTIIAGGTDGDDKDSFYFATDDKLYYYQTRGGAHPVSLASTQVFRDSSAWYHILLKVDTTLASGSRHIVYVNGYQITMSGSDGNNSTIINTNVKQSISTSTWSDTLPLDGYLAEVNFIDGTALTPSSFGETDEDYGHWKPKAYDTADGAYGTNGFYLDFSNTSTKHAITASGDAQHSTTQSKIGSSSLYFDGSGDYLSVPDSDDWKLSGDFTIEGWIYVTAYDGMVLSDSNYSTNMSWMIIATSSGGIKFVYHPDGTQSTETIVSSGGTWNTDTWYHFAVSVSGTTLRLFQDGSELSSSTMSTNPFFNSSYTLGIGCNFESGSAQNLFTGYMDEIRISNNARYTTTFTPSTTAFTDDDNTLLLIHSNTSDGSTTFTDSSGVEGSLGNDQSGEDNHFTPNNLAAADQMLDSPTNNFCTLNPLSNEISANATLAEGNLKGTTGQDYNGTGSTMNIFDNGKTYFEFTPTAIANDFYMGIAGSDVLFSTSFAKFYGTTPAYTYRSDGLLIYNGGSNTSTDIATFTVGDVIQIAVDTSANKLWIGKNNTWQMSGTQNPSAGTGGYTIASHSAGYSVIFGTGGNNSSNTGVVNFGQDSSFAGNKTAQGETDSNGIGDFYYEPPTDFLALCTSNLPDPAVTPSEHFNTVLYSGSGTTQSITGVNFQPDFTWIKQRSGTRSHGFLDSIRGGGEVLFSNNDAAEVSTTNTITSFDSDGFSLGNQTMTNESGTYVAWNWKANGSGSSNTDGSITSTVSANQDAGFSIVSYEGTGVDLDTIGHGLSKAPEMYIVKNRDQTDSWKVGAAPLIDRAYSLLLDDTNAENNDDSWGNKTPTSTVLKLGQDVATNTSGEKYIGYMFHSVEGFSRCGTYEGNGSTDGVYVHLGFRPMWLMIKCYTNSGPDWIIRDSVRETSNVMTKKLTANSSTSEDTYGSDTDTQIDFLSNGFKLRGDGNDANNSSRSYIYYAIAEQPFKHTNAK